MTTDLEKNTTICALMDPADLARLKGHKGPWVYYSAFGNKWIMSDVPHFHCGTVYRTVTPSPVPDSIDWSQIDDSFICMARDRNGNGCATVFTKTPTAGQNYWNCNGGAFARIDNLLTSYKRGTVDWRDSLVFRPGYKGAGG